MTDSERILLESIMLEVTSLTENQQAMALGWLMATHDKQKAGD